MTDRAEMKRKWRWNGTRICANCLNARDLAEEEQERLKAVNSGRSQYDPLERYCTYENKREKYHPHYVCGANHCFAHEYDDESVLLPTNPKWCDENVIDLWPYERDRAEKLREEHAQICMDL